MHSLSSNHFLNTIVKVPYFYVFKALEKSIEKSTEKSQSLLQSSFLPSKTTSTSPFFFSVTFSDLLNFFSFISAKRPAGPNWDPIEPLLTLFSFLMTSSVTSRSSEEPEEALWSKPGKRSPEDRRRTRTSSSTLKSVGVGRVVVRVVVRCFVTCSLTPTSSVVR